VRSAAAYRDVLTNLLDPKYTIVYYQPYFGYAHRIHVALRRVGAQFGGFGTSTFRALGTPDQEIKQDPVNQGRAVTRQQGVAR
jgi:hypothetical protein